MEMWKNHELLTFFALALQFVAPRGIDATVSVMINANVSFPIDKFTEFYNCLCGNRKTCTARFSGNVYEVEDGDVDDLGSNDNSIYYHCAYETFAKIKCLKSSSTHIGARYDIFNVPALQCNYSCVALIWSREHEGIHFSNTGLDVQQCDDDCVCPATTTITPLSTTTTTRTTETSCISDSDSGLPLYVIVGVAAGVVIIVIIIDVVVLLSWKRKCKRDTSNQQNVGLAEMNNLGSSPQNRSTDRQLSSHYSVVTLSRPSRNLDAHNGDMIRNNDDECVKVTVADSHQKDAGFGYAEPDHSYDTETAKNASQLSIGEASMNNGAEQSKNIYSKLHEENRQLQNPYNTLPQIKEDTTHDA